jgi:hypothetical protein
MFSFDLTGSMGGIISTAKAEAIDIMAAIQTALPDSEVRFGVTSYMDYPDYYTSCGYSAEYGYAGGGCGDYAYNLDQGLTSDTTAVAAEINGLIIGCGSDGPQDYTRIFYESYADSDNIGWGEGVKIWINFGDNVPHDCDLNEGVPGTSGSFSTGGDPGRDEVMGTADDLDLQTVLAEMAENNIILMELHTTSSYNDHWTHWTELTGGSVFLTGSSGAGLIDRIVEAVEAAVRNIDSLTLEASAGYEGWLASVDPAEYTDIEVPEGGVSSYFDIQICVPAELECGLDEFSIDAVGDGAVLASQDVTVDVPCNDPPVCDDAAADLGELWPPNHKLQEVSVTGVTDPDGDPVTITITSIFQDEPLNSPSDGNTCPDGTGVGTDTARVRAERSGNKKVPGDGRVYHVGFDADDGQGGACVGAVAVCVPHDQRPGHVCVDQGPLFDSTSCP